MRPIGLPFCLVWLLVACGRPAVPSAPHAAKPSALPPATGTPAASGAGLSYRVQLDSEQMELRVEAHCPAPASGFEIDPEAADFLRDVEVDHGHGWESGALDALDCQGACSLRYRFALGQAADELEDFDVAGRSGNAVIAPLSTWLLRPLGASANGDYALTVATSGAMRFVTGTPRRADGAFVAPQDSLRDPPYAAFGALDVEHIAEPGGDLEIASVKSADRADPALVRAWLTNAARAIDGYFGRFPVSHALALVLPARHHRIHGKQLGMGGASILFQVGGDVSADELAGDWKAVHEMVHVATPSLSRRHLWLMEGLATYVEPLARVRAGLMQEAGVWRDLASGMPKGLPGPGDQGLDNTHTWGRTYWGGALFCFLADIQIRQQSGGKSSLRSALSAVMNQGGTTEELWPIERFLRVGDAATGTHVLEELYREHGSHATKVDLRALFDALGVHLDGEQVRFDDTAPLAGIRRAITRD